MKKEALFDDATQDLGLPETPDAWLNELTLQRLNDAFRNNADAVESIRKQRSISEEQLSRPMSF